MKKFWFMAALLLMMIVCGCGFDSEQTVYRVTFDLNYETPDRVTVVECVKDDTVAQISDPTREGYVFVGWYLEKDGKLSEKKFDFISESITEDTVIKAVWEKKQILTKTPEGLRYDVNDNNVLSLQGVGTEGDFEYSVNNGEFSPVDEFTVTDDTKYVLRVRYVGYDSYFEKIIITKPDASLFSFVPTEGKYESITVVSGDTENIYLYSKDGITYQETPVLDDLPFLEEEITIFIRKKGAGGDPDSLAYAKTVAIPHSPDKDLPYIFGQTPCEGVELSLSANYDKQYLSGDDSISSVKVDLKYTDFPYHYVNLFLNMPEDAVGFSCDVLAVTDKEVSRVTLISNYAESSAYGIEDTKLGTFACDGTWVSKLVIGSLLQIAVEDDITAYVDNIRFYTKAEFDSEYANECSAPEYVIDSLGTTLEVIGGGDECALGNGEFSENKKLNVEIGKTYTLKTRKTGGKFERFVYVSNKGVQLPEIYNAWSEGVSWSYEDNTSDEGLYSKDDNDYYNHSNLIRLEVTPDADNHVINNMIAVPGGAFAIRVYVKVVSCDDQASVAHISTNNSAGNNSQRYTISSEDGWEVLYLEKHSGNYALFQTGINKNIKIYLDNIASVTEEEFNADSDVKEQFTSDQLVYLTGEALQNNYNPNYTNNSLRSIKIETKTGNIFDLVKIGKGIKSADIFLAQADDDAEVTATTKGDALVKGVWTTVYTADNYRNLRIQWTKGNIVAYFDNIVYDDCYRVAYSYDGTENGVAKIAYVFKGEDAPEYTLANESGKLFMGWDKPYANIQSDTMFVAQWTENIFTNLWSSDEDGQDITINRKANVKPEGIYGGNSFSYALEFVNAHSYTAGETVTATYANVGFARKEGYGGIRVKVKVVAKDGGTGSLAAMFNFAGGEQIWLAANEWTEMFVPVYSNDAYGYLFHLSEITKDVTVYFDEIEYISETELNKDTDVNSEFTSDQVVYLTAGALQTNYNSDYTNNSLRSIKIETKTGNIFDLVKIGKGIKSADILLAQADDDAEVTATTKGDALVKGVWTTVYTADNYRNLRIQWTKGNIVAYFDNIVYDDCYRVAYSYDGTENGVAKIAYVFKGEDAPEHTLANESGKLFMGWDKPYTNIQSDTMFVAQWTENVFTNAWSSDEDGQGITINRKATVKPEGIHGNNSFGYALEFVNAHSYTVGETVTATYANVGLNLGEVHSGIDMWVKVVAKDGNSQGQLATISDCSVWQTTNLIADTWVKVRVYYNADYAYYFKIDGIVQDVTIYFSDFEYFD